MRNERLFYHRCFLNDKDGAAMVEASVTDETWNNQKTGERHPAYSGCLHLTDCSRSIELDASFSDDAETARAVLRKLDRLIDAAQGMRDALARAAKREWPGKKF